MREERKVITALYADLADSTPLGERLDPEDVRLIVGEAIARMAQAVERFGGTVKDFAGDAVVAFFGAPQTHEDDAERAIRAGLEIVSRLEPYAGEVADAWGVERFGVRVGICSGPVVLGRVGSGEKVEYMAFGDTVNTAARLQANAKIGTVLVAASAESQTGSLFTWGPAQELELKGKDEPVVAHEVIGVGPADSLRPRAPLVGRQRELETAREAAGHVLAGSGHVLFLTGEAGIGKSRLVSELQGHITRADSAAGEPLWLEGRSVSYAESMPYWPFRDLLMHWLGMSAQDPDLKLRVGLHRQVGRACGEGASEVYPYLGSMLGTALEPDAAELVKGLGAEELQQRTFAALATLFRQLAEGAPLILILEDLHWADATSVELVRSLLPLCEEAAILLVLIGRPDRGHPLWEVMERAGREWPHRTTQIALGALSTATNGELLRSLLGSGELPANLNAQILELAEGNPFYLEEVVKGLEESGCLVRRGDALHFDHEAELAIPPTVEKVILGRIDRLRPTHRELLAAGAALGRDFGLPMLEGVAADAEGVRDALRELQRLDLLREARRWPYPEYRFTNTLIQEAVYRTLLADQRAELHRRAADWLEREYADNQDEVLGLLAHHWRAAGDRERAIHFLVAAAEQAGSGWAKEEALNLWDQALRLIPETDSAERRRIAMRRAVALIQFAHAAVKDVERNPEGDPGEV